MLPAKKRGDTFMFVTCLQDENGVAVTGASQFLKSEIRNDKDVLISELLVEETETPGEYLFKATDTLTWPTGVYLYTDVQYTLGETVLSSETIRILIEKDVTK